MIALTRAPSGRRALSTLVETFSAAPVLGGLALAGAAVLASGLRSIGRVAIQQGLRRVVVRAEFDSRDDSYRWMLQWLTNHPALRESNHFTVASTLRRVGHTSLTDEVDPAANTSDAARAAATLLFVPAGSSVLRLPSGRWALFSRERHEGEQQASASKERESLTLHILGGSQADVRELVGAARLAYLEHERMRTGIFFAGEYGGWDRVASKPARPMSSVVLNQPGEAEGLLRDCRRFLAREEWYAKRGIPYRRGFLLHGPPGTGKSSLVAALAGALRLDIYLVNLTSARLTDDSFAECLASAAPRCVLLLEDIDAAFTQREAAQGGLSFAGLLNGIDGVAAQEGRLLFLTTNHPEKLDPALIRPGRIDVRVPFGLCTREQVGAFFRHFYGEAATDELVARAAEAVPPNSVSVATLQGILMEQPDDPVGAVEAVRRKCVQ